MNWIIKFNQLEKENTDKALDLVAKFDKYKNDVLDDVYTKAYGLEYLIDNINVDAMEFEELDKEISKLSNQYNEVHNKFDDDMNTVKNFIYVIGPEIRVMQENMIAITSRYIRTNREYDMLYKRIDLYSKKLVNITMGLCIGNLEEMCIFREIRSKLKILFEIAEKKLNKEVEEENGLIEKLNKNRKTDYQKIFDYKDMIAFAETHEYKQVRQSGDHIIMQHKKTNKIVPIPAHELKYGLMLQIQKQIQTNKVS